ncbi:LysR family transcriptional regulator, partial [Streptomyces asiaticus]
SGSLNGLVAAARAGLGVMAHTHGLAGVGALALATAHTERALSEYRLRRPIPVRTSKHSVNTASGRN